MNPIEDIDQDTIFKVFQLDKEEFVSPDSYMKQDHLDKDWVRDAFGSVSPKGYDET